MVLSRALILTRREEIHVLTAHTDTPRFGNVRSNSALTNLIKITPWGGFNISYEKIKH